MINQVSYINVIARNDIEPSLQRVSMGGKLAGELAWETLACMSAWHRHNDVEK